MISTFLATLHPLAILFICMGIGFALTKLNILPPESARVLSKLVIWVLYPALCFITMANFCTVELIYANAFNLIFACIALALSIVISFVLVGLFAKKGSAERGVYRYALTFGNSGYMGDPLVLSIFGDVALTVYKIYTIPISLAIYTWGVSILTPNDKREKKLIKSVFNPPMVAIFLGMIVGLSGLGEYMPSVIADTLSSLKSCMGPVVMMMAGCTVAGYSLRKMLTNARTYVITLLRLILIPSVIIGILFLIILLVNNVAGLEVGNASLYLTFFAIATPLGLNTVVYPKSFGADAEPGAGMALISHTLCVITIPLMFTLMELLFGQFA